MCAHLCFLTNPYANKIAANFLRPSTAMSDATPSASKIVSKNLRAASSSWARFLAIEASKCSAADALSPAAAKALAISSRTSRSSGFASSLACKPERPVSTSPSLSSVSPPSTRDKAARTLQCLYGLLSSPARCRA